MLSRTHILIAAAAASTGIFPVSAEESGAKLSYTLDSQSFVTIVIEKDDGTRVRNLVACAKREVGENSEIWDGLDDSGHPVPPGRYRWCGISHDEISSHFQGAFYSPGNPPWLTNPVVQWNMRAGSAGGWLSDHAEPLCVHAAGDKIFIGAKIAEAGHSLIEIGTDFKKSWGSLWFSTSGADAVAVDNGIIYVAGEKGWMGDKLAVHRVSLDKHSFVPNPPAVKRSDAAFVQESSKDFTGIRGMAVTDKYIVLSLSDKARLALFGKETAAFVRDVRLAEPGGLAKNSDGAMFAVSGNKIVKADLEKGTLADIVTMELQKPSCLAVDINGDIYVTDSAPSEQCVKVFSADGKFLRTIGTKGGRREGAFDRNAMGYPMGIAIDSKGRIWIAEHDFLPKRVSVWSKEGELIKDFIGPPHYGGGGSVEPKRKMKQSSLGWIMPDSVAKTRAFYKGMVFEIRPWPTAAELVAVAFRPEEHEDLPVVVSEGAIPQHALWRGDKLYLVTDQDYGIPGSIVGELVGDHLLPRAILGTVAGLKKAWKEKQAAFVANLAEEKIDDNAIFLWSDKDEDGMAEPAEISLLKDFISYAPIWRARVGQNLELHAVGKESIIRIPPKEDSESLEYDFANSAVVPLPKSVKLGISALASDRQGNFILNLGGGGNQGDKANMLMGLSPDGTVRWTYPNPFPANWHSSPRPKIGDIQHTLNVEGFASVNGFDADVFQLNGNKGVRYLFTCDGLFICQLFGDMRTTPAMQSVTSVKVGDRLDQYSLCDECFYGWFGEAPDGRIMQIEGKDSCNLLEVRGLETLVRMPGGEIILETKGEAESANSASKDEVVKAICSPQWKWYENAKYPIPPDNPVANFAVAFSREALIVHIEVKDDSPFMNSGEDFKTLFKTGDAIDLRLALDPKQHPDRKELAAGDVRILVANFNGKPAAVLYRFVVPGTSEEAKSKFSSPTGTAVVDSVTIMKNVSTAIAKDSGAYTAEITIPWKELGLSAAPRGILRGDVGVIMSDSAGTINVARYYHFDQKSQVTVDLPSETCVDPSQWGRIEF